MRISLSLFEDKHVEALTLCGIVRDGDPLRKIVPEKASPFEMRMQLAGGPVWFRLIVNWQKKPNGVHFHIDTATEASLDGDLPTERGDEGENNSIVEALLGRAVDFNAYGKFVVPRSILKKNSVVNLLLGVSVGPQGGEASLRGASYKIGAGPVEQVQWKLLERDGNDMVKVRVVSNSSATIGTDMLTGIYEPMASVFRTLVLEEGLK